METGIVCPSTQNFPFLLMGSTSKPSAKGRGTKNVARGVVRAVEKDNEFIGKLVAFFLEFPYGPVLKSSFG
jgi:hypothetical protein